ncbi:MAG: hypothetical protein DRR16_16685 [Candidatus Parabeggiatoa sp. nov. 3]|jgi:hypothetical protein|nr:MAG: hypothetical protein DRQ99_07935 [Gammaproteobacteria bacterium]RKZ83688.1 MAG: hypothetical protein DRR16_16685 [Gammaproteobacteria bacterium]
MSFSHFKKIEQVIEQYPLKIKREEFLPDIPQPLPEWFLENLKFSLCSQAEEENEFYLRESLIFPFLQQAWKSHNRLKLWSHRDLNYDNNLCGEPDYFFSAWRDEVIDKLVNTPILAVAEAKKQDFDGGWAQCLAEMIACQKLNQEGDFTVYGIVSTGIVWQFGKLSKNLFTKHPISYSIDNPQKVFGNLDYIFTECEKQIQ